MTRHDWSRLNHLQLGKYAEHLATMRLIELGLEVYSTEVDDRGIDKVVRYAPGRCLEIQVKSVRGYNLTFFTKNKLGDTDEEIERRMRSGYCLLFVHFVTDGCEPDIYLIPGYAWLTPNKVLVDNTHGDVQYGPNFELRPSKKNLELLAPWRLTGELVEQIIAALE